MATVNSAILFRFPRALCYYHSRNLARVISHKSIIHNVFEFSNGNYCNFCHSQTPSPCPERVSGLDDRRLKRYFNKMPQHTNLILKWIQGNCSEMVIQRASCATAFMIDLDCMCSAEHRDSIIRNCHQVMRFSMCNCDWQCFSLLTSKKLNVNHNCIACI